jgi:hypothetical protein
MCYADPVGSAKQNVTLVVDEDLLLAARKIALDRGTSVNQLVREYLTALVEDAGRKRMARARLKMAFDKGLIKVGKKWRREELYER